MVLFLSLCAHAERPNPQVDIQDYGRDGISLPLFLGETVGDSFFAQSFDQKEKALDYHARLPFSREFSKGPLGQATGTPLLRLSNPNENSLDVIISAKAKRGTVVKNFLVRLDPLAGLDVNIQSLAGYEDIDLICMMPFESFFITMDARQRTAITVPLTINEPLNRHRPEATSSATTGVPVAYMGCSPTPACDDCEDRGTNRFPVSYANCPGNALCTSYLSRYIFIRTVENQYGGLIALAKRTYVGTGSRVDQYDCEDNGGYYCGPTSGGVYKMDVHYPATSSTPFHSGLGSAGNQGSSSMYPCMMQSYVTHSVNDVTLNWVGDKNGYNAVDISPDDVLAGSSWGYSKVGAIRCTVQNGCATGSSFVAFFWEVCLTC